MKNFKTNQMTVLFKKWGNSIGVIIPKNLVDKYGIELNKEYEIIDGENGFAFKEKPQKPTIDQLLEGMDRNSRYDDDVLIKDNVGKERFWENKS